MPPEAFEAGAALTSVKAALFKSTVARPHESVDQDSGRGSVSGRATRGPAFTSNQRRKLKQVYYLHCWEMKRWVRLRQAIVVTVSGKRKVKWASAPPVVDWNRVAYHPDFGIFRAVKEIKAWVAAYGKQLRKEIRAGLRDGMPAYVVRALLSCQSSACPPALTWTCRPRRSRSTRTS